MALDPLEQLTEMTSRVRRNRQAPIVDPTERIESEYASQLRELVRIMARAVKQEVLPVVKEEKQSYKSVDAYPGPITRMARMVGIPTKDTWSDRILSAIRRVREQFEGEVFRQQSERLAQRTVRRADALTTESFVKSVNKAVGVDLGPILDAEEMQDYINVSAQQNAELIKSIPQEYFKRIEEAVIGGVRGGEAPTSITRKIQEATGVSRRRARFIARDQTSKLTGEINERRQRQAGVKYFRWRTAQDQRVGDDHRRAANRRTKFGKGIYRWDRPPPEGIPGSSTRPNCRCYAVPVFEWEIEK